MASNNIARLGVVLGIDTAVFSADIDKAISENRRFGREMKRGSEAAMQEALNLKYATEDYGKEISRLAQVERQLATGRMSMAHDTVKQALRDQAKAYDDAVAAAKRLQQAQAIDKDVLSLKRATEDYGKVLSQVQITEREIADGKYRTATSDQKSRLLDQAQAYDAAAAAAKRYQQAQAIDKEIQALKFATEDYGKTLTKVQQIERDIATGKYRTATDDQKKRLLDQARAFDAVAASQQKVIATQGKLTDQQRMALSYQTTDIVTSLVSGQNPFMVLMQQGGQLKDQFGGVGNVFRAFASVLTPVKVAIGGVAASLGVLGVAFYQGARESMALRDQLILTSNYANLTQKTFLDLADAVSSKTNLSIGNTKDILMELVSSGKFTGQSLTSVALAIANVAKLSGKTASEVAQNLIPAFNGGASSIKSLNDTMHFLTLEQYKYIVALDKQGRSQEAAKVAADALNKKLNDQKREVGDLERAWTGLKNIASQAWNALLNVGRPSSIEEKIPRTIQDIVLNAQKINEFAPGKKRDEFIAALIQQGQELNSYYDEIEKRQADAKKAQQDTQGINDEAKFGSQRRAMDDALAKQRLENFKTQQSLMADAEMQARSESDSKISAALIERNRKNREEAGVFATQNEAEYQQTVIASRLGLAQKLMEIQQKRDLMGLDLRKQQIEQEFNIRFNQETEIGKVEAERDKKIALARLNLQKKNIEERNLYAKENDTALAAEIVGIEADANRQIEAIRLNRFINLQNAVDDWREENNDQTTQASVAQMKAAQALAAEIDQKFLSVEQDRASLQLQMELVGLSEKERNIALNRLQTEQEIAAIRRNDLLTPEQKNAEIERIKMLGLQRENLVSMQDDLRKVGEVNNAIFGNMEKAIENFVRTGKFSFKDFARSVIQYLIMIELKAAATSILRTIIGAAFPTPTTNGSGIVGPGLQPPRRAAGGPVSQNSMYMVGERGPELFVPRTSGTIVPNHALASMSAPQVINNYNIQAIDVKSFEDRIMGSSNAVWAANAYANKSLAIGRGRV